MPSFFFHIAVDLHKFSKDSNPDLQSKEKHLESFKTITSLQPDKSAFKKKAGGQDLSHYRGSPQVFSKETDCFDNIGPATLAVTESGKRKDSSNPTSLTDDWRYGKISVHAIDMAYSASGGKECSKTEITSHITDSITTGPGGFATKGRYEPSHAKDEDLGWGIVRLYRDNEETPGLYDDAIVTKGSKGGRGLVNQRERNELPFRDEDCTTLCILAVPSYITPSDFLGFVGEKTRDEVSHFRMIRTERSNRYMVLMKFRNGKKAREWRKEWNGKAFDAMEPENCHVVFVRSIELRIQKEAGHEPSFPDMTNDPFTPSLPKSEITNSNMIASPNTTLPSASRSFKPVAPPTPALIELPTCPVCLERMDESTGLLTILCQHVFHCSCLQKWRGSGCPVCRYAQHDTGKRTHGTTEEPGLNECSICKSEANLWVCLICGNVGCGRYDAAHAFSHYEQSSHCFAMDLTTQRIWDYASDGYVHRIVQNKADGKLVELPSTPTAQTVNHQAGDDDFDDYVPREKLDNISLEYTHLLTSQLDSQRMYFEENLERAADKTSQAAHAADTATEAASLATQQLATLQIAHDTLTGETIPALERERDRASRRAAKFEAMARKLEKEWREEKAMSGSLLERVQMLTDQVDGLRREKGELEEQNRDLGFFISGGEKLKAVVQHEGGGGLVGLGEEEVRDGVLSLPEAGGGGGGGGGPGGKRKGKGRR